MLNYRIQKTKKINTKLINELVIAAYDKYSLYIDKKDLSQIVFSFIEAIKIKCKEAIVIYDENKKIICFCPYYFVRYHHDQKIKVLLNEHCPKINNPSLKKMFMYF